MFYISSELKKKSEKTRYIFAGKLSEKKGVMSFLKSICYIPNAGEQMELLFAGGYGNEDIQIKFGLQIQILLQYPGSVSRFFNFNPILNSSFCILHLVYHLCPT